jgi:hypothetical protein
MSRASGPAFSSRISSSQQAMPPPRSLAHVHQPLRGVITTNGGSAPSVPASRAVTFSASTGFARRAPPDEPRRPAGPTPRETRLFARHLEHRRTEWFQERIGVARTQARAATSRDTDNRLVTGRPTRVPKSAGRGRIRCAFGERQLGVAAHRSKTAFHAGCPGEGGVEQRHAWNVAPSDGDCSGDWIDAGEWKRLEGRRQTSVADFGREPLCRQPIDVGAGPMNALFFVGTHDLRDAL